MWCRCFWSVGWADEGRVKHDDREQGVGAHVVIVNVWLELHPHSPPFVLPSRNTYFNQSILSPAYLLLLDIKSMVNLGFNKSRATVLIRPTLRVTGHRGKPSNFFIKGCAPANPGIWGGEGGGSRIVLSKLPKKIGF